MNKFFFSWKVRFELSRLWMPIEPIVYDSTFYPGDVTDYYERYIVTREIRGYRLWNISYFVCDPLNIRKLDLFSDKLFAIEVAKKAANNKYFIGKQGNNYFNNEIGSILLKLGLANELVFLFCFPLNSLLANYHIFTSSTKPVSIQWSQAILNLIKDCSTEKSRGQWNLPLLLGENHGKLKNSCDRTLE